jgi:hypothetical protein
MTTISFARRQFASAIIRHAVWLYVRFTLRFRDVEDLLAERGLDVFYETVRRWVLKFAPLLWENVPCQSERSLPRPLIDQPRLPGLALGKGAGLASVVSGTASCDYPFLPEGAAKHPPAALAFHDGESEGEPFHGMAHLQEALLSLCDLEFFSHRCRAHLGEGWGCG